MIWWENIWDCLLGMLYFVGLFYLSYFYKYLRVLRFRFRGNNFSIRLFIYKNIYLFLKIFFCLGCVLEGVYIKLTVIKIFDWVRAIWWIFSKFKFLNIYKELYIYEF